MPRRIFYTAAAVDDIERMRRWYGQPGAGPTAKQRARRIVAAIRRLRVDPVMWPRGEVAGTRERIVEGYAVIYTVDPDTNDRRTAGDVYVLRVYGPGQDRASAWGQYAMRKNGMPPIHPGEFLAEILGELGLSQVDFARRIAVSLHS
ncbi:MAG: type II toxin-antitoxin system RelE/ParE family toxin [Stellaceae bacterium]